MHLEMGTSKIKLLSDNSRFAILLQKERISEERDGLIASAVGGLAVPLIGVGLGPGESAVVSAGAVHDSAVIIILALAGIAVVVVSRVDRVGDTVTPALGGRA